MKKNFITSIMGSKMASKMASKYLESFIDIPYIENYTWLLNKKSYKKEKSIKPNKTFFLKNKRNIINQPKRIKK